MRKTAKKKKEILKVKKSLILLAALTALAIPLSHTVRASADTADAQRYVISAVGQVYADADIMTISAGVDTYAVSLEDGQEQNARAAKKIEEVFSQYGKVREDYFSAYPAYDKSGFNITRQLCCKTDKLDKLDEILSALAQVGATKICSVNYCCSREDEMKIEALKKAIAQVKEKAAAVSPNMKLVELNEFCAYPVCYDNGTGDFDARRICIESHVQAVFEA